RVVTLEQGKHVGTGTVAEMMKIADEVRLRVVLLPEDIRPAMTLLRGRGYATEQHGSAAAITVDSRKKAEPLALLAQAGHAVTDFDVEDDPWDCRPFARSPSARSRTRSGTSGSSPTLAPSWS